MLSADKEASSWAARVNNVYADVNNAQPRWPAAEVVADNAATGVEFANAVGLRKPIWANLTRTIDDGTPSPAEIDAAWARDKAVLTATAKKLNVNVKPLTWDSLLRAVPDPQDNAELADARVQVAGIWGLDKRLRWTDVLVLRERLMEPTFAQWLELDKELDAWTWLWRQLCRTPEDTKIREEDDLATLVTRLLDAYDRTHARA